MLGLQPGQLRDDLVVPAPLKLEAEVVALHLQPSVGYFASGWPVDTIWQANQQSEVPMVDLASGGTTIEIRRADEGFSWQRLDPSAFAFRRALAEGFGLPGLNVIFGMVIVWGLVMVVMALGVFVGAPAPERNAQRETRKALRRARMMRRW